MTTQNRIPLSGELSGWASLRAYVWAIVGLLLALVLGGRAITTVPPGHNAVATLFGKVQPAPYGEGFHVVNPLLSFTTFDLRQQTRTWEKVHVPSQDKLKTSMDVSLTFRVDGARSPEIMQDTGNVSDVIEKHVTPKVRSLLREAGKSVERSQDFYQEAVQQELQAYMEAGLSEYLAEKGVVVEAVLFRDITLPPVVQNAVVQTKERQEQLEREKAQLAIVEQQAQQQVKQAEAREMAAVSDAKRPSHPGRRRGLPHPRGRRGRGGREHGAGAFHHSGPRPLPRGAEVERLLSPHAALGRWRRSAAPPGADALREPGSGRAPGPDARRPWPRSSTSGATPSRGPA